MDKILEFWSKILDKIELQSILVLFMTLTSGIILIVIGNSYNKPSGILGIALIVVSVVYTFISFIFNQTFESFKNVSEHYKKIVEEKEKTMEGWKKLTEEQRKSHYFQQQQQKENLAKNQKEKAEPFKKDTLKTIDPDDLPF